jgi:hypothetical protein
VDHQPRVDRRTRPWAGARAAQHHTARRAALRRRGAIDFLRVETGCDTFLLAYKARQSKGFSLVNSVGYSDSVARYLSSDIQSLPEFQTQFCDHNRITDWEDVPEFPDSYSGAQVLRPEGFTNGFLMVLHDGTQSLHDRNRPAAVHQVRDADAGQRPRPAHSP